MNDLSSVMKIAESLTGLGLFVGLNTDPGARAP